jgi:hypothetical protein
MTIQSELEALRGDDGLIHAEEAVEWAAKHPKSALYAHLEWDDKKAGHQYRIWQVRNVLLSIVNEEDVRQEVSLSIDRATGGGYRNLKSVMSTKELREVLLADALAELNRLKLRFSVLTELARVWEEVDKVGIKTKKRNRRSDRGDDAGATA